jgi:tRNA(Ile)-lysidine synthase TilS/MesJ
MLEAFKKHIAGAYPELEKKSLLIACSGGLDSVVL